MSTCVSGILLIPLFSKTLVKNYKIEWTSGLFPYPLFKLEDIDGKESGMYSGRLGKNHGGKSSVSRWRQEQGSVAAATNTLNCWIGVTQE